MINDLNFKNKNNKYSKIPGEIEFIEIVDL